MTTTRVFAELIAGPTLGAPLLRQNNCAGKDAKALARIISIGVLEQVIYDLCAHSADIAFMAACQLEDEQLVFITSAVVIANSENPNSYRRFFCKNLLN